MEAGAAGGACLGHARAHTHLAVDGGQEDGDNAHEAYMHDAAKRPECPQECLWRPSSLLPREVGQRPEERDRNHRHDCAVQSG